MGRMYTARFKEVSVSVAQDLFEILAGSNKSLRIHGFSISQKSEVGDAQEEGLTLTINRGAGSVTSGSSGSTATPAPVNVDDSSSGATVEINNTTIMTTGSGAITELEVHSWNVRVPYTHWWTPETRPFVKSGDRLTIELETPPADSITMSGVVWFEEIG